MKFGASRANPKAGVEYHFVIDESGEGPSEPKPVESKSGDSKPGGTSSLLKTLASSLLGERSATSPVRPGVKPSQTPITYDRLYFDANRDLDLTNDPILLPIKDPPAGANPFASQAKQTVLYDYLAIPFDYGPGLGTRPFRLLPRLMIQEYEGKQYTSLFFVATVARQGQIRIGSREYDAVLAQPYVITGPSINPARPCSLRR